MKKNFSSALLFAIAGLSAVAASPSAALAQPPSQNEKQEQLNVRRLGTVTVTGSQIQALQEIKQALHRVHSTSAADADKLVCNISNLPGSHVNKTLTCETNRQWWHRTEIQAVQLNISLMSGRVGGRKSGGKALTIALQGLRAKNMAFALPIRYDRFRALLEAVPPVQQASDSAEKTER